MENLKNSINNQVGPSDIKEFANITSTNLPNNNSSELNIHKIQKQVISKIRNKKEFKTLKNGVELTDNVRRPFSPKSEKYIRKMDRLVKLYEQLSEKNMKLKYHILRVKNETKYLLKMKRTLCNRLAYYKDPYMDQTLEIPDHNQREVDVDNLIADVITSTEPLVAPPSKKKKVDIKRINKKEESKEQESKKEVINRILSAASSVMQQEEQKGALKKIDLDKPSTSKTTMTNPIIEKIPQQKQIMTAQINNSVQSQMHLQNVYVITTPIQNNSQPVNQNIQSVIAQQQPDIAAKPQLATNYRNTQPELVAVTSHSTPCSSVSTTSSPNSKPISKPSSYAVVTHHEIPRPGGLVDHCKPFIHNSQSNGTPVKPPSPLHAQITTTPLPPKTSHSITNADKQPDGINAYYGQRPITIYSDPSKINPQLLPHRQIHARRIQEQHLREEREKAKRFQMEQGKSDTTTMIIAPQQQMIVNRQGQMQHIIIPSSGFQQVPIIQSQPRLSEALQNARNEVQRKSINPQQIQVVQTVQMPNQSTTANGKIVTQTSTSQMFVDDSRGIIYIDQSRLQYGGRSEVGQMVVPLNMGTQTVRYIVPQASMPQTITIKNPKQQPQQRGNYEKLLRASSIDHLLPQNPDNDHNNDDNIDWSKYDEPKPRAKKSTPRKKGVAMKLDANSDAMARISPILAKFQQEMAQSTAAQKEQQQQQLTMAGRNAAKTVPARARKRPQKVPSIVNIATSTDVTPSSSSEASVPTSTNVVSVASTSSVTTSHTTLPSQASMLTVGESELRTRVVFEDKDGVSKNVEITKEQDSERPLLPTIIVTAATPEPQNAQQKESEQKQQEKPNIATEVK